MVWGN